MKLEQYKVIIKNLWFVCVVVFLSLPFSVYADPPSGTVSHPPAHPVELTNPLVGNNNILVVLGKIINDIILPIGVTVSVVCLVYAGFLYVTAQGSEEKIRKAHGTFLWTVVGAAVLLGAWTISQTIKGTLCQIATIPGICG